MLEYNCKVNWTLFTPNKKLNRKDIIHMRELSNRSANFTDSVIRRMTRVANKYGAVNLSQGFPDFDPPKAITDRLARVAGEGPGELRISEMQLLRNINIFLVLRLTLRQRLLSHAEVQRQ